MTLENIKIAVVIPVYNEALFVKKVVAGLPSWIDYILLIDDGSVDDSHQVMLSISDTRIKIIKRIRNGGVGAAICSGYSHALQTDAGVIVVMAGDGQMDPRDLPVMIEPILHGRADYVKGNRFKNGFPNEMPLSRLLGNLFFSLLTSLALRNFTVFDSQCGFTAIAPRALKKININELYPSFGFPNDMLFRLVENQCKIATAPVKALYGVEKSKIRMRHLPLIMKLIVKNAINMKLGAKIRSERPVR